MVQSEAGFVAQARRAGWSDQRIAAVPGFDDGASLPDNVEELARAHPSHNSRPWTG